ncbi:NDMA-dependent alcohol dehydrogenase [Pimelobacter simplex]|uniref:NDMA-dependent alcohol dehydrogenase n=1 Tax=Nocardioides simplex TaxID=2045 RepID=A0A7J5E348_NOCSI|nr:NDMA-dependent alcohol dehydrogenase [Pimelobacter simplex]KAB2812593.1 NDMA-dependent alcohol dehydrogenase [Pimelobacter simplex]
MRTRGAIVRTAPGPYEVVDLEVADPAPGEVQVRLAAAGLCHSDDHIAVGDSPVAIYPFALGHEGAGVVTRVGAGVDDLAEGDHVVFSFLPACGRCRWCATGMQNLCDDGGKVWMPPEVPRVHLADGGAPVGQMCGVSAFMETTTVSARSVVKVGKDIPLDKACLVGCGVATGWGAAVNSGAVRPGHVVIVMGIGGIGINAVQGAVHAGATTVIAVDPVEFKREEAKRFGATHAFATMDEAAEIARQHTNGQGADSAIVTVGVVKGEHVGAAFGAIRKGGTAVVTGLGNNADVGAPISLTELTLYQKRIQGSLFGECNPTADIPALLDLYRAGMLKLDEIVTRTYTLDEIGQGYEDMHAGRNLRGVVLFD